jgi:hypothetical protein
MPDRNERLHTMLSRQELEAIDTFRSRERLPSRSAGRELFRLGMAAAEE